MTTRKGLRRPANLTTFCLQSAWVAMLGAVFSAIVSLPSHRVEGAEPYQRFLSELRRLNMHDTAVMYLQSLKSRKNLDPEIRKLLPYEEGISLLERAKYQKDTKLRSQGLDAAAEVLAQFAKDNPKHPKAAAANTQLGNVLVERAVSKLKLAKRPTKVNEKPKLLAESRELFAAAQQALVKAEKQLQTLYGEVKAYIDSKDRKKIQERDAVRADYLLCLLHNASVFYEWSKAYDREVEKENEKRVELLKKSATKYDEIAKKNRKRLVGSYAIMWQGRSLQEIGTDDQRKQAMALYRQLLAVVDKEQSVRGVQFATVRLAMACLMDYSEPKLKEVVELGRQWIGEFRGSEDKTEDGLAIKLLQAQALKKIHDATEDKREKSRLTAEGVKLARDVARWDVPFAGDAKKLLAEWTRGGLEAGPPEDFQAAVERAKEALDNSQVFAGQRNQETDEQKKKELTEKSRKAEKDAHEFFQLALKLRDVSPEPPTEDELNQVYYYLCFLNYQRQNFYDAALLGEYLAKERPSSAGARPGAKIALASYGKLYNAAPAEDRAFESRHMESIAEFIAEKWPRDEAALQARLALIDVLSRAGRTERLISVLANIPEDANGRATAELKVGNYLWIQYLKQSAKKRDDDTRLDQQTLDSYAAQAAKYLKAGVQRAQNQEQGDLSATALTGRLSLAQVHTRGGAEYDKALAILEDKKTGLLPLVKNDHPLTKRLRGFRTEVLKIALQAYVNTDRQDDAIAMMDLLDKEFTGKGAASKSTLTKIYIKLGRELQADLERFAQEDDKQKYQKALSATKAFLSRIIGRSEGNTFQALIWVANTFRGLGEGALTANQKKTASEMFQEADRAYRTILQKDTPGFWPEDQKTSSAYRTQIKLWQVACLRGQGQYEKALEILKKMLAETGANLQAQQEAAITYEEWGVQDGDLKKLRLAMMGLREDPSDARSKKVIWGWSYMSKVMQKYIERPGFAEYFHESRYHLARCLYEFARLQSSSQKKKEYLEKSAKAIVLLQGLYPTMGGDEFFGRYQSLLKKINRELGSKYELEEPAEQGEPVSTETSAE